MSNNAAFYNSAVWKHLRAQKLAANPLCEACLRLGRVTGASDVDHIRAINNGGHPTAWANLQSLCHECHSAKTLYVDMLGRDCVPVKGCDATGRPLDPKHFWNRRK
jgi:5-methylcytosine-specific restriction protein A